MGKGTAYRGLGGFTLDGLTLIGKIVKKYFLRGAQANKYFLIVFGAQNQYYKENFT